MSFSRISCSGKQEEEALDEAKAKDGDSNLGRKLAYLDKQYILTFLIVSWCEILRLIMANI